MNPTPLDDVLKSDEVDRYVREIARRGASDEEQAAAREYASQHDVLHGDIPATPRRNGESPIHIMMCYMVASGKSKQDIAKCTGYTPCQIGQIMRQPWFRQRFLEIAKEAGMDQVEAFVKGETLNSLETLVAIRDDVNKNGATRVSAANSILDRALGKPTVHVESETKLSVSDAASSKEDLDRQIAAIHAELQTRGQSIASIPTASRN